MISVISGPSVQRCGTSTGGGTNIGTPQYMFSTSPEQNIGPRMDTEGYPANKPKYAGDKDATASKKREGKWQAGFDKAKAEDQAPTGPEFKKGGAVKSSASSRGDGIAARGKTRGRVI